MSKHTPGPWRAEVNEDGEFFILADGGKVIGCGGAVKSRMDENKANGPLIAAAPDLLEALRPFALVYEKDISVHEDDADLFQVMHAHNRAPKLTVGDFRRAYQALMIAEGRI